MIPNDPNIQRMMERIQKLRLIHQKAPEYFSISVFGAILDAMGFAEEGRLDMAEVVLASLEQLPPPSLNAEGAHTLMITGEEPHDLRSV